MKPRTILQFVLLAYVVVTAAYGLLSLYAQYSEKVRRATHRSEAMALLLEEHVRRTVDGADLVVQRVIEAFADDGFPNRFDRADFDRLSRAARDLPQVGFLSFVDRDAVLRLTTQGYPFPEHVLTDRAFYQAHRDGMHETFVGPAVVTRAGDVTFFTVSRPIYDRDGAFDGLALAAIDVNYFRSVYEKLSPGPNGALAILRSDGALLLRQPFSPRLIEPEAQQRVRNWLVFSEYLPKGVNSGGYTTVSSTDGIERIVAFRKVAGLPLVVMVMEASQDLWMEMAPDILRSAAMGAVTLVMLIVLTLWAFRILAREEVANRALLRSNDRLAEALDEAQAASRAKSVFLSNMSHELRTPLNAILGFTEVLRAGYMGRLESRQNEYLGHIHEAGQHLLDIIGEVLDLSKVSTGRMEVCPEVADMHDIAAGAMLLVRHKAAEKEVALATELPEAMPLVRVDPVRFKQVLINLLSNAVKFNRPGGRATLSARIEGGRLLIQVADDGIGMRPDQIPTALEAFGELASSPTKSHGGAGVGLSLSKALVELHGGGMTVRSQVGAGTTVSILLPPECLVAGQPEHCPA